MTSLPPRERRPVDDRTAHERIASNPRVMLDTSILLDMSDGTVPSEQVEALHRAMQERGALLLLSVAHFMDLTRDVDADVDARLEAVGRVVDAFPRRAFVAVNVQVEEHAVMQRRPPVAGTSVE